MLKQTRLAALMGAAISTTISLPGYAVEGGATIEEIIVSAQRRDQNLRTLCGQFRRSKSGGYFIQANTTSKANTV